MIAPAGAALDDAALGQALTLLARLNTDPVAAGSAEELLAALRAEHPGLRLRLLRHREAYGDTVQFGLLVSGPRGGTVTLSWAPPSEVPWMLRGAQRSAESMLLRVNGEALDIQHAMAYLDVMWEQTALLDRLVDVCLVQQELAESPVTLTDGELQDAMDAFRRARGLLTPAATAAWMARRHLDHAALEEMVAREAAVAALRTRVTVDRVDSWCAAHRSTCDRLRIARVRFADRAAAERFVAAFAERRRTCGTTADAFGAALTAVAPSRPLGAELMERTVADLDLGLGSGLADAVAPGTLLPPRAVGTEWEVVQVLSRAAASESDLLEQASRRLFDEWLADRRRTARIEWFWGEAEKTPR